MPVLSKKVDVKQKNPYFPFRLACLFKILIINGERRLK
jgi:hypothetical protein